MILLVCNEKGNGKEEGVCYEDKAVFNDRFGSNMG